MVGTSPPSPAPFAALQQRRRQPALTYGRRGAPSSLVSQRRHAAEAEHKAATTTTTTTTTRARESDDEEADPDDAAFPGSTNGKGKSPEKRRAVPGTSSARPSTPPPHLPKAAQSTSTPPSRTSTHRTPRTPRARTIASTSTSRVAPSSPLSSTAHTTPRTPRRTTSSRSKPSTPRTPALSQETFDLFEALSSPSTSQSLSESQRDSPMPVSSTAPSRARGKLAAKMAPRRKLAASSTLEGHASAMGMPGPASQASSHSLSVKDAMDEDEDASVTASQASQSQSQSESQTASPASRAPPRLLGASAQGTKRTYANQRSFLADVSLAGGSTLGDAGNGDDPFGSTSLGGLSGGGSRRTKGYTEMRERYGVDGVEDEEMGDGAEGGGEENPALRSITALRSAGEMRRFNDELEYLLSGFEGGLDGATRRSSAVEVGRRFCADEEGEEEQEQDGKGRRASKGRCQFLLSLQAASKVSHVWDVLGSASLLPAASQAAGLGDVDEAEEHRATFDAARCAFLLRAAESQGVAEALLRGAEGGKVWEAVVGMWERCKRGEEGGGVQGGAKGTRRRKGDRGTADQMLRHLANLVPTQPTLISPVRLALVSALSLLARLRPRPAFDPLSNIASPAVLELVTAQLRVEADLCRQRLEGYGKGMNLIEGASPAQLPDLPFLHGVVELLLTLSLAVPLASSDLASPLCSVLRFTLLHLRSGDVGAQESEAKLRRLASGVASDVLKLLVNLTHDGAVVWSQAVLLDGVATSTARSEILDVIVDATLRGVPSLSSGAKSDDPACSTTTQDAPPSPRSETTSTEDPTSDIQALSLGLLTNLLEAVPDRCSSALSSLRTSTCGRRACCAARSCSCAEAKAALTALAELFVAERRESASERATTEGSFLAGCLAVLLALAFQGEKGPSEEEEGERRPASSLILAGLEGSTRGEKLRALVEALEDFGSLSDVVQSGAGALLRDGEEGDEDDEREPEASQSMEVQPPSLARNMADKIRALLDS